MKQKDYFTTRVVFGREKIYWPRSHYCYHPEGDVTFKGRHPRKIKKWIRKEMGWGRYKPWWTNHDTRSTQIPRGILQPK